MSTSSVIVAITLFCMFAIPLFTSQVYQSFLDKRIRDKKALLSVFESAYKSASCIVLYCFGIILVLVLVIEFATTIELPAVSGLSLFLWFLIFLSIPRVLISNLKTSIEEEAENTIKSTACSTEDAGQ